MISKIKKWFKEQEWGAIVCIILMIVVIISALAAIGFYIWAFVTYKDTPLAELPWWVLWILR